jgi:hypothetical protein
MPEEPTAPPRPSRRRVPSARRFAAGALASFVAIFGVLALRVHDGDDPALANVKKATTGSTTTSSTSQSTQSDPYDTSSDGWDDGSSSDDSGSVDGSSSSDSSGSVSSTPGASTSAS